MTRGKPRYSNKYKLLKQFAERYRFIINTTDSPMVQDIYNERLSIIESRMKMEQVHMYHEHNDLV